MKMLIKEPASVKLQSSVSIEKKALGIKELGLRGEGMGTTALRRHPHALSGGLSGQGKGLWGSVRP